MKSERVRLVGTDSVRYVIYSAVVWGIGVIRRTDGRGVFLGGIAGGKVSFRFVLDVNVISLGRLGKGIERRERKMQCSI